MTSDPAALDSRGFWAVVVTFEGDVVCARFGQVRDGVLPPPHPTGWLGPRRDAWTSSLDRAAYLAAVDAIRARIAAGDVYQANLCRVLSARVPDPDRADVAALGALLARGNPSPYGAVVRLPDHGVNVAGASPELFLSRRGSVLRSGPIKGTGRTVADLQPKDWAENVMIVDLVRNDLARVATVGSVDVPGLCVVERHPGLVHLVSHVEARMRPGTGWADVLAATFPPGSVTGAPKAAALSIIASLEPVPRGPYCGALGWVDADAGTAEISVAIRTFWTVEDEVRFGTGAGITWGSDAAAEWAETELKASRLLAVASSDPVDGPAALARPTRG